MKVLEIMQKIIILYILKSASENYLLKFIYLLKDICFTYYNHLYGYLVITINNYIKNIREYFILERYKVIFEEFRNSEILNCLCHYFTWDIYEIVLKEKYVNKYFDKFLSFFDLDNDYNNEKIKAILDNYSTLNQNEYTKLKRKED